MIRALKVERMAESIPQLQRGQVWCRVCGFTMSVDSARCLKQGWPKCCKQTMTIDVTSGDSEAIAHWATCTEQDSFRKRD